MKADALKDAPRRVKLAKEAIDNCSICPRCCSVNRNKGELGFCRLDSRLRCFREMLGYNEEALLSPSHQIYFAGCNLACEFCTVREWNEKPDAANEANLDYLAERIRIRQSRGARTVNFLGGEPAVNIAGILELLGRLDSSIKVVWNSNMFYGSFVSDMLEGLVDIYLADLKCGNDKCAKNLLGADNYLQIVRENISKASRMGDVIVRHVIMPGHLDCCLEPTLRWLADNLPLAKLSLKTDYVPPIEAKFAPKGYLSEKELQTVLKYVQKFELNII